MDDSVAVAHDWRRQVITLHHDNMPSRRAQRGPAHSSGSRSMREKRRCTHETPPTRSRESTKCQIDRISSRDEALVHEAPICTATCPGGIHVAAPVPAAGEPGTDHSFVATFAHAATGGASAAAHSPGPDAGHVQLLTPVIGPRRTAHRLLACPCSSLRASRTPVSPRIRRRCRSPGGGDGQSCVVDGQSGDGRQGQ
jgi:hypothetical protein